MRQWARNRTGLECNFKVAFYPGRYAAEKGMRWEGGMGWEGDVSARSGNDNAGLKRLAGSPPTP